MFDDVLDPNNDAYIATFLEFKNTFEVPVAELWTGFTSSQKENLERRGYKSVAHFWLPALYRDPHPDQTLKSMFLPRGQARRAELTREQPDFNERAKKAVSLGTIESALRTPTFARDPVPGDAAGFGSTKAPHHHHSDGDKEGILEGQPHDNVHGMIRGFMGDFLSPVDPIFFLHHANIDRLWDVWTRRQAAPPAHPALPEGADVSWWQNEQFLFFSDENGQPVSNAAIENYKTMSFFDYDYEPGSGENMVSKGIAEKPSTHFETQTFSASLKATGEAGGVVNVPGDLLRPSSPNKPPNVTQVTLDLSRADRGRTFEVRVSVPGSKPVLAGLSPCSALAPDRRHSAFRCQKYRN